MSDRRILFIGQTGAGQTSGMRRDALVRLGYTVSSVDSAGIWNGASYLVRQIEQKSERGARIDRFNDEVTEAIRRHSPHLIWAEKQELLDPAVLQRAKSAGITTVHYNPDPYFTVDWKRSRRADACLAIYDILAVTKHYELEQYRSVASGQVVYTPLGFDPVWHRPAPPREPSVDIAFIGGWEPKREALLSSARRHVTPQVAIWGYGWRLALESRLSPLRALRLGRLVPSGRLYLGTPPGELASAVRQGENRAGEVYGRGYAEAVAQSRIVLGFLREAWPDQHTTRTFEIPAMQGFMLADRTEEHMSFFQDGEEAVFFSDEVEFLDKAAYYLRNETQRQRIAEAGRRRCLTSGYSYDERMAEVLRSVLPVAAR